MTPWNIVATSCSDDLGNVNPSYLLESNPRAVIFSGDLHYSNMGTSRVVRGTRWDPDIFWREGAANPPTNARTVQRMLDRFELWNGEAGFPNWTNFWAKSRAMGVPCYWQLDDHDLLGDNWDHTTTVLSSTFPDSYVGTNNNNGSAPFGQVINAAGMTQADVLYIWRLRQQAKRLLLAKYTANPASPGYNGDIPNAMVGTATAADYDIDYFPLDFGPNGEPGGSCIRLLLPDSVSYKSRMADTDNSSKTFLGAVQTAWMQAQMLDAKNKGFAMVVAVFTKDVFGSDNNDGMGAGYTTWRNQQLLTFKEANGIPLCIISGDKHLAHTSISRKDNNGITDLVVHCASPFGSRHSTLVQHPELVWAANRADMPVFERISVDPVARTVSLATVDGYDPSNVLNEDVIPWFQSLPMQSTRRNLVPPTPKLGYTRTAVTVTASPFTWQNTTGRPVSVVITGGTISDVSISQDNFTTTDSLGTQRQVQLQHGESVRTTYSAAHTMAYYPVLTADER